MPVRFRALVGVRGSFWKISGKLARMFFPPEFLSLVVVKFNDTGGLNKPTARRSDNDHVYFQNLGKVDRELTLSTWVFTGTAAPISVPAGKVVGPFVMDPDNNFSGTVRCYPDPPFGGGAPGDPQFESGD